MGGESGKIWPGFLNCQPRPAQPRPSSEWVELKLPPIVVCTFFPFNKGKSVFMVFLFENNYNYHSWFKALYHAYVKGGNMIRNFLRAY